MRYPSNSGVLWKVVFGFLCIIDTEQTAQIRWNTTGLRCLCLQFHSSRIPTVRACIFVAMYYSHPCRLAKSLMAKQNCSHRANVICDGSPSRIRMVRRISLGMTTRPSYSENSFALFCVSATLFSAKSGSLCSPCRSRAFQFFLQKMSAAAQNVPGAERICTWDVFGSLGPPQTISRSSRSRSMYFVAPRTGCVD